MHKQKQNEMKTVTAINKSTGIEHEVEIYNTFVYFVNQYRKIAIEYFNESFIIKQTNSL